MARDGAHVVAVDIPAAGDKLAEVANEIGGTALQLDITAADAPQRLVEHLRERHGGVDVVVHNAGITRDKLLVNMDAARWNSVMAVNLQAQLDITQALLDADGVLKRRTPGSSASARSRASPATAGRPTTRRRKAGVIGMVRAWAPAFAERGATINAVAPGFIVTEMTAKMPFGTREVGSRLNSLQQGGLPVDVAETIAWLVAAGQRRGQRPDRAGLRPVAAGGLMAVTVLDEAPNLGRALREGRRHRAGPGRRPAGHRLRPQRRRRSTRRTWPPTRGCAGCR